MSKRVSGQLDGIDPDPAQVQRTVGTPEPEAPATAGPASDVDAIIVQPRRLQFKAYVRRLMLPAALVALLALAAVGWSLLRAQLFRFGSLLDVVSVSQPQSNVKLTPPLICTGIGADGAPVNVSDSFSEALVRETGVGVFLTYSGAVPQKNTFQIRWYIEGGTYESKVQTFENKADILYLNLGKDLPAGTHKIEFLVDGVVRQTASVVIEAAPDSVSPRVSTRQERNLPGPTQQRKLPRPTKAGATPPAEPAVVSPSPAPLAPVPSVKTENPDKGAKVTPEAEKAVVYQARHWHGIGSCMGELKLTPQNVEFTSESHAIRFDIKDIRIDHDGFEDPSGKGWHFFIAGTDVELLFGRWKRGELFASSPHEAVGVASQSTQSLPGKDAQGALSSMRTYDARHKHNLGSCSGELKLTPEMIEFSSQEHYFKYQVNDVQIDRDGILDRNGKIWRFDILGENVAEVLRLWKAGKLFSQDETRRNNSPL